MTYLSFEVVLTQKMTKTFETMRRRNIQDNDDTIFQMGKITLVVTEVQRTDCRRWNSRSSIFKSSLIKAENERKIGVITKDPRKKLQSMTFQNFTNPSMPR